MIALDASENELENESVYLNLQKILEKLLDEVTNMFDEDCTRTFDSVCDHLRELTPMRFGVVDGLHRTIAMFRTFSCNVANRKKVAFKDLCAKVAVLQKYSDETEPSHIIKLAKIHSTGISDLNQCVSTHLLKDGINNILNHMMNQLGTT